MLYNSTAKEGDQEALLRAIEQCGGRASLLNCAPGFDGNTPLHWAVEKGHPECIRILCESGASVEVREMWQSWTPLMLAVLVPVSPQQR